MQTIFYSWQSDLPNSTNRGFIGDCLEKAVKELHAESAVEIAPASVDRDTKDMPGSPDIADAIFEKIDNCSVFVGDVSFINGMQRVPPNRDCDCTRLTPNPNVLCEWGRASKSIGFDRIICVLNEATGSIEKLPFDLRKRKIVTYCLNEGDDKAAQRKQLIGKLKSELKGVLELPRTDLALQFADSKNELELGDEITIKAEFYEPLDDDDIPDHGIYGGNSSMLQMVASIQNSQLNVNYFREKANYLLYNRLLKPVALAVKNTGSRLLRNVRLAIVVPREDGDGVLILEEDGMPELPKKSRDFGVKMPKLRSPSAEGLEVKMMPHCFKIEFRFGDIQPKATEFSRDFFIGSRDSKQLEINGLVYADELSNPQQVGLTVAFESEKRTMTMDDLRKPLPEEKRLVADDSDE